MSIRSFFLPKSFSKEMQKGQLQTGDIIRIGMESVLRRGKRWFNFFSWLPIAGNIIFYMEGKRDLKRKSEHKSKRR